MKKLINILILLMGLSCFSAQTLFIREFLIIFGGNELIIGIILANWLLTEALGSFILGLIEKRIKSPHFFYALMQIAICLLFPLSISAVRIIKVLLNIPAGEGLGILLIFSTSLFLMLPLGFLLGGQFPLCCRIYVKWRKKSLSASVGKSYWLEAIGFSFGGIIITCFLIPRFNSIQIAFIIGWANLIIAFILLAVNSKKRRPQKFIIFTLIIGTLIGTAGFLNINILHEFSLKKQWQPLKVVGYKNSVYANTTVIQQKEQYAFYSDGIPFMSIPTPDIVFTQDIVNFPQTLTKNQGRVLLLGAGLGGIISNLLQFPVKNIDYAELDPTTIKMTRKYLLPLTEKELTDPRVKIHYQDGRLFLRQFENKFDTIIMNLPAPSTLMLNRYYTLEFFELIKQKLTTTGFFCFSLPGSLSYLSKEQIDINKCILTTLKKVFPQAKVIPGYNNLFLASKNNIDLDAQHFIDIFCDYKISSPLFTNYYIKDRLDTNRQTWFYKSLKNNTVKINKDLEPIGVFYTLKLWNALFTPKFNSFFKLIQTLDVKKIAFFLFLIIAIINITIGLKQKNKNLLLKRSIPFLVLSSGMAGVCLNLIFILSFQTFYGYVYSHFGFLISAFMAGLTLGAMLMSKKISKKEITMEYLLKIDLVFVLFSMFSYPLLFFLKYLVNVNVFFLLNFIFLILFSCTAGFLVGFEFPLANKIYLAQLNIPGKPSPNILYAVDMLGSFFGASIVSIILIPGLGIPNTIIIIFLMKAMIFSCLKASLLIRKFLDH